MLGDFKRLRSIENFSSMAKETNETEYSYPPLPELESVIWRYDMRREMQEIIPNLYLGPYASARRNNYETLKKLGITHIVCVRQFMERKYIYPNFPDEFQYLIVELADNSYEMIIPQCKTVCSFLKTCLDGGGKALVHGNGGSSRSAALVIAFIMSRYGLSASEAHRYVQLRRFCINPNDNFVSQLREYEPIYRAYNVPDLRENTVLSSSSLKRTREMRDLADVAETANSESASHPLEDECMVE